MKIYDGLEEFHTVENAVVTSGTFDGVHLGHQKIITRLNNAAQSINGAYLPLFIKVRQVLGDQRHCALVPQTPQDVDSVEKVALGITATVCNDIEQLNRVVGVLSFEQNASAVAAV